MERLLARLERRYGRYAPENVIVWVVGLSGAIHLLVYARPDVFPLLTLEPAAVLKGEFWRVFTFLFAPLGPLDLWGLVWAGFELWFLNTMGMALEAQWGALRFDLFLFVGALATLGIAFVVGPVTGLWLATALLLAFAAEFPDVEVLLIIIPLKVKWLGVLSGAYMVYAFITSGLNEKAAIGIAVLDLFVFCGATLREKLRGATRSRPKRRLSSSEQAFAPEPRKARVCAKCGRSSVDEPTLEFRVCDCQERCGGKLTEYCIDHARNH